MTLLILPVNRVSGADADPLGNRRLVVDADVGRFVRREDVGLRLLDTSLGDRLAVHGECRLAALADTAAVVGEVERDGRRTGGSACGAVTV